MQSEWPGRLDYNIYSLYMQADALPMNCSGIYASVNSLKFLPKAPKFNKPMNKSRPTDRAPPSVDDIKFPALSKKTPRRRPYPAPSTNACQNRQRKPVTACPSATTQ
ncbi:hypothetical protein EVAR_93218_1 [Eumeta japonica]|uniref:Uncharacterized protein n=1 Tax=Eumeta variegata TaxID=151549 RepID=A0A4C1TXR9_EUMVA|nr:hypothetical protein EVAR_93218_1 [Eumeta japonica]